MSSDLPGDGSAYVPRARGLFSAYLTNPDDTSHMQNCMLNKLYNLILNLLHMGPIGDGRQLCGTPAKMIMRGCRKYQWIITMR